MIKRVAILGAGLLGGSVAISAKKNFPNVEVALWARNPDVAQNAREMGITLASSEFSEAVRGADLVILATPVGTMSGLVKELLGLRGDEEFLITDVGSVKRLTHEQIEPLLDGTRVSYVGSHPMAGSEKKGFSAAHGDLLNGAACILTSADMAGNVSSLNLLEHFWTGLGCRIRKLSPEDHDYAVARISHFPHAMASMVAMVGLSFDDIGELAGGGLRDTTRVAAGDPELWTEIMLENRDALQRSLTESIAELDKFQEILKTNNEVEMLAYLTEAKRRRDLI
ncbi:MAG: prephenate dehydrogenase [Cryomorphaceae bacterium]|jgi:prephenate dehydrogenase